MLSGKHDPLPERPYFYIYAFKTDDDRFVKVGKSIDPDKRIKQLNSNRADQLLKLATIKFSKSEQADAAERIAQEILWAEGFHYRNEWFEFDLAEVVETFEYIRHRYQLPKTRLWWSEYYLDMMR